MAYWLVKTEPSTYSFADLQRDGRTRWDGITNPVALRHLQAASQGDGVVVYHTGGERRAVGLAEVVKAAYPDPRDARLSVVELGAGSPLRKPVELAALKADPLFAGSPLVRQGRLSFVPLDEAQYRRLLALAGA